MKFLRYTLLVFVYLALSACDTLTATKPVGLPIWYEMQGLWVGKNYGNDFYIDVRLLPDGSLHSATTYWDEDKERFMLEESELIISVEDGVHYINSLVLPTETVDHRNDSFIRNYSFMRIIFSEGGIAIAFNPNIDVFAEAIESGTLPGKVKKAQTKFTEDLSIRTKDVYIDDPEGLAKFIDPKYFSEQFVTEDPASIRRIYKYQLPEDEVTVMNQAKQSQSKCLSIANNSDIGPANFIKLTQAALNTYWTCMRGLGYEFIPNDPSKEMYIVNNAGLGLFTFRVELLE
jgi:hypothetical protein